MRILVTTGSSIVITGKASGVQRASRLDSLATPLQQVINIEGVKAVVLIDKDGSYTMYSHPDPEDEDDPLNKAKAILEEETASHASDCDCPKCTCFRSF